MRFAIHFPGVIGDIICWQENRGRKSMPLEHRKGIEIKIPEPVIKGNYNAAPAGVAAGALKKLDGTGKADDIIAILPEKFHLRFEALRSCVEPEVRMLSGLRFIAHAVIHEDGNSRAARLAGASSGQAGKNCRREIFIKRLKHLLFGRSASLYEGIYDFVIGFLRMAPVLLVQKFHGMINLSVPFCRAFPVK